MAKNTIQKLTRDLGEACLNFQDHMLRGLTCRKIQADEVWNFCYAKEIRTCPITCGEKPGVGSMWTWTALSADSKLIVSWRLAARDGANAYMFMSDVAERLTHRVQLTTDGNTHYQISARVNGNAANLVPGGYRF